MSSINVTLHDIDTIKASSSRSFGAPLTLSAIGGSITFFLDDQDLVDRLVTAINGAVEHKREPDLAHQEAHDCVAEYDRLLLNEATNIERIEEIERNRMFKR